MRLSKPDAQRVRVAVYQDRQGYVSDQTRALDRLLRSGEQGDHADPGTAWHDQADAASRDAARLARLHQRATGGRRVDEGTTLADQPAWLRLALLETLSRWGDGSAKVCRHAPSPNRPQPIYAAAYRPGLVVCGWCLPLLMLQPGSVADRTCDACGRVVDTVDEITPHTLNAGPVLFRAGTCAECLY